MLKVCRSRLQSRGSSFRASRVSYKAKPLSQHDDSDDELDFTAGNGALPVGEELYTAITMILTNPTFIFLCLAGSAEGFLMQGISYYLYFNICIKTTPAIMEIFH